MADRTFNGVDARVYKEFRVSKTARLILAYIIANCPNPYGVYDPNIEHEAVDWFDGLLPRDQLVSAFEELVSNQILTRFRGGECLWLRKKFKREIKAVKNPNMVIGAVKFLVEYPEILDDFKFLYFNQLNEIANQFVESGKLDSNWFAKIGNHEPEPEPEPEPESIIAAPAADDSTLPAKPQVKRTKAERPPLEELEATLTGAFAENWKLYKFAVAQKRINKSVSDSYLAGLLSEYLASMKKHGYSHDAGASALLLCMRAHTDPPAENERYFRKCCSSATTSGNGISPNGSYINPTSKNSTIGGSYNEPGAVGGVITDF